jgi:hypothetical protein
MGYLPGFEDDVFISYAHNDDDRFPREEKGWVAQLHADLEERVKYHLGQPPRLWRDCEIRSNEDFAKKIANRLAHTATLLSVLSHNFLQRPWCQKELEEFCRSAERTYGLAVGDKRRIFKAERYPTERESLPPQLDGTGMYKFYGSDPEQPSSVHEYRPSLGEQQWKLYFLQLDTLAQDIAVTLRMMREEVQGTAAVPSAGGTVYVAETTLDQELARNRIKKDLQDRKIAVLPQGDLPYRGPQFEQQVREYLKQSDLSIHIFGGEYGFVPEGRQRPHTWLQHDLALERAQDSDFRRIVWMPSTLESPDERQRQYLDSLRTDPAVQRGAEILQDRLEDLKTEVLRSLEQVRRKREERAVVGSAAAGPSPAPSPSSKAPDEPLTMYIVCDAQDFLSPSFLSLNDLLLDRGYEPLKSAAVDNAEEARRMHEENLQICDACIIYYGAASDGWVNAKLLDFLKLRSKRQTPFLSKAVYVAPPDTPAKRVFRTNQAKVIQGGSAFSADQLSPFLEPLQRR